MTERQYQPAHILKRGVAESIRKKEKKTGKLFIVFQTTAGRTYSEKREDGVNAERQEEHNRSGQTGESWESAAEIIEKNHHADT